MWLCVLVTAKLNGSGKALTRDEGKAVWFSERKRGNILCGFVLPCERFAEEDAPRDGEKNMASCFHGILDNEKSLLNKNTTQVITSSHILLPVGQANGKKTVQC